MTGHVAPQSSAPSPQRAAFSFAAGGVKVHGEVTVTNGGLVSVAALVSVILLSTAVLVRVAAGPAPRDGPDQAR